MILKLDGIMERKNAWFNGFGAGPDGTMVVAFRKLEARTPKLPESFSHGILYNIKSEWRVGVETTGQD